MQKSAARSLGRDTCKDAPLLHHTKCGPRVQTAPICLAQLLHVDGAQRLHFARKRSCCLCRNGSSFQKSAQARNG